MSELKSISAEEFFSFADRPVFEVEIPGLGSAKVRECDVATISNITKMCSDDNGNRDTAEFAARVIVAGCVEPKFTPNDIERLKKGSHTVVMPLFNAIMMGKKNAVSKN